MDEEPKITKEAFKEEVQKLLQLQDRDIKLRNLFSDQAEQPRRLAELNESSQNKGADVERAKEEIKRLQAEVKKFELEVQANQEKVIKYSNQLFQVKTNEEYRALEKEIELLKQKNSGIEDQMLQFYDDIDGAKKTLSEKEAELVEEQKKIKEQEVLVEERLKNIEIEIKQIQDEKDNIEVHIAEGFLNLYRRVFAKKHDAALAPVDNYTCMGCHMALTHQVVSDVKRNQNLVTCESCSRILYLP